MSPLVHQAFTSFRPRAMESPRVSALRGYDPTRPPAPILCVGELEVRPAELQVLAGGRRVGLTAREFQVFLVLVERCDRVVLRQEVYELVWGGPMARRDRSVDVFVRRVRRKLEAASPDWLYIHTHFGIGYRFTPDRVAS